MKREEFAKLDKLHKIWRVAIDDFAKWTARGHTFGGMIPAVNMSIWLVARPTSKTCYACMAGAVIASRLLVPDKWPKLRGEVSPWSFGWPIAERLKAINNIRSLDIGSAYLRLYDRNLRPDIQEYFEAQFGPFRDRLEDGDPYYTELVWRELVAHDI